MNRQELLGLHATMTREARELMSRKNEDYAGLAGEHTVFGNLGLCESMGICPTEIGIIIRLGDKLSRLANILQKPAMVDDESIHDTLVDVVNYAVLIAAKQADRAAKIKASLPPPTNPDDDDTPLEL